MNSVGRVQIPQTQDINQLQAESHTNRYYTVRQKTVPPTPEGEKVQLRERRQRERDKGKRREEGGSATELERREEEEIDNRLHITV